MRFRTVALIAAADSLVFGVVGLLVPGALASVLVGTELGPLATVLVRLACAGYLGYGLLAWLARDMSDPTVKRMVALPNGFVWGLSGVVLAVAAVSGLGTAYVWIVVAMQAAFAAAWLVVGLQMRPATANA